MRLPGKISDCASTDLLSVEKNPKSIRTSKLRFNPLQFTGLLYSLKDFDVFYFKKLYKRTYFSKTAHSDKAIASHNVYRQQFPECFLQESFRDTSV